MGDHTAGILIASRNIACLPCGREIECRSCSKGMALPGNVKFDSSYL